MHQGDGGDRAVVAAEEDQVRSVLQVAVPDDDEVAEGVGGDGRIRLVARRVGVDAELGAEGSAGAGVALAEDAPAHAVLDVTLPGDDEVAGGVGGDGGTV